MGKRELVALLNLSSLCLVMVERLFLVVPRGCLQFVIVVFPNHTHLLFSNKLFLLSNDSFSLNELVCVTVIFNAMFKQKHIHLSQLFKDLGQS